ncbi:Gfo/Idh/MocA family protein [Alkalihalobacillus trypoxylicola]|uniref:Dehydrogenase n=1 Tax=Alkalihalobacillus trypoxylicola TaxID=519424 RepID=A0A161P3B4_9BACI|nr:Gfo/Idh/MocA family oxidoreductase [Alkalihalobacillus trypoxylicola]KYG26003.1 dehydrogenase [Alkalihalobacillus trypoxylicola]
MTEKIKWGILSTGSIANQFTEDLPFTSNGIAYAVGSRTIESAKEFAKKHSIERAYGSYDELVNDPEIDAIYVGTPHPYHKENVLTCLRAGKAVLCEKPFTINANELEELITYAREHKLFLMEAMWTRFLPPIQQVREWIKNGDIGEVSMVTANFGFHINWDPQNRLLNLELGGGALLDTGIYPISFASMILGSEPESIHSTARIGETGVDEQFSVLLSYPSGKSATLNGAVQLNLNNEAYIYGSKGYIHVPNFLFARESSLHVTGEDVVKFEDQRECRGYAFEAEEVGRNLLSGKLESDIISLDESLAIMKILDSLRSQWGLSYPSEKQLT